MDLKSPTAIADRIELDPPYRQAIQTKILRIVIFSQVLGGAGLAAGITVGALLAQEMLGNDSLAGLPAALFTLGSAMAAFLIGRLTQQKGRRLGLGLGFSVGGLGAIGVIIAAVSNNVVLLFASLFIYGAGSATNLQARYSGTDLALPNKRATSASIAMVSTTVGAVAGPNLVEPLGVLATRLGIPALAGPFLLAAVAYLSAGTVLLIWLRPDPFLVARALAQSTATKSSAVGKLGRGVFVGAAIMIVTQISMLAMMSMTPVHMRSLGFDLSAVGLVIGLHIASMYLPSLITGPLVDKVGRTPMAVAAGITLLGAGLVGAFGTSLGIIIVALMLLGLGWNFGLISGSAMLVDATPVSRRAKVQGTVDVMIALAGAVGSAISGLLLASTSFPVLALGCGVFSLVFIPLLVWGRLIPQR